MKKDRCDWSELVMSDKDCDRIASATLVAPDGTSETYQAPVEWMLVDDGFTVNGRLWPVGTTFHPTIEPGQLIEQFAVCFRRAGHRGRHGYGLIKRRWLRLTRGLRRC